MAEMILGVFSEKENADDAIEELKAAGFDPKDISIVMKDTIQREEGTRSDQNNVAEGAVTGATTGAAVGALAGLLIGIGAIAIPGVGALLIGGPVAAALGLTGVAATTVSGAATGVLAGGLVGALMGLGLSEEDARVYEEQINAGAILIAVPTRSRTENSARDILEENGADRLRTITMDTEHTQVHA